MHIPDGILPIAVSIGGYAATGLMTWYSLKKINQKEEPRKGIPKASLGIAAFFVITMIQIPVPPMSIHLVLTGLLGILLGYYAFPAVLISLLFQAILFQHGGLTTLGINALILGLPAFICYYLFKGAKLYKKHSKVQWIFWGFLIGALGVLMNVLIFMGVVATSLSSAIDIQAEKIALNALMVGNIPLIIIEGVMTATTIIYLRRIKPSLLEEEYVTPN